MMTKEKNFSDTCVLPEFNSFIYLRITILYLTNICKCMSDQIYIYKLLSRFIAKFASTRLNIFTKRIIY